MIDKTYNHSSNNMHTCTTCTKTFVRASNYERHRLHSKCTKPITSIADTPLTPIQIQMRTQLLEHQVLHLQHEPTNLKSIFHENNQSQQDTNRLSFST